MFMEIESPNARAWTLSTKPRPKGVRKLRDKLCFWNAFCRSEEFGWRYVEGWALTDGVPIHHAWCVDDKGTVIETTWKDLGEFYYGCTFDLTTLATSQPDTRYWQSYFRTIVRSGPILTPRALAR